MKSTLVKTPCPYAHNLLDNSDFTSPVNQRWKTKYTTGWGYTLDRWYLGDNRGAGEEAQALEIVSGGVKLSGNHVALVQRLPLLDGTKTYTAAYMRSDGTINCRTLLGSDVNQADLGYAQIPVVTQPETIVWAALYEGIYTADTLPPYVPKGFAAELAECRRYYVDLGRYTIVSMDMWNTYYSTVVLPVPMRSIPTITLKNPVTKAAGTIGKWDGSGTFVDFTGFIIASLTNLCFVVSSNGKFGSNALYTFMATASADL